MKIFPALNAILLIVTMAETCSAQGLFGERDLGGSLSRRTQPGCGARRFLREERAARDFVGSTGGAEAAAGFIGRQSAVTAATSAVTGLREEARPPVNRPRTIRQGGLYAERLRLAPETQSELQQAPKGPKMSKSLETFIRSRSLTIEVSPEGRSAILRGAVPSEHDRQTTAVLVTFEPGIQKVENELTVDPRLPPIQRKRPDREAN